MRTPNINQFIKKVYDVKNGGAREFRMQLSDAEGVVLELSQIITDNHLISFEDLKEALINSRSSNSSIESKRVSGGTF